MIRIRVSALIVNEKKEVLLVNHQKDDRSYWLLPGGGLDSGEKIPDCFSREMKEETGLIAKSEDLIFATETIYPGSDRHILHLVFSGTIEEEKDTFISEDERVKSAKYVNIDELKKLKFYPDIKEVIIDYINGKKEIAIYNESLWLD